MPIFLCSVDMDTKCNVNAFAVQAVAVYLCACVSVYHCVSVVTGSSSMMHISFNVLN